MVSWVVKGPSVALHHLQYLAERPIGTSVTCALLGHAQLSRLSGCCNLGLVGLGFLVVPIGEELIDMFEVYEHHVRQLWDGLVRQVVPVPPHNREVRQDDTHMSSLCERNISKLHRGDSQKAVLDGRDYPYKLVKCLHPSDVHLDGPFHRLFHTTHEIVFKLLHCITAKKRELMKFDAFYVIVAITCRGCSVWQPSNPSKDFWCASWTRFDPIVFWVVS